MTVPRHFVFEQQVRLHLLWEQCPIGPTLESLTKMDYICVLFSTLDLNDACVVLLVYICVLENALYLTHAICQYIY